MLWVFLPKDLSKEEAVGLVGNTSKKAHKRCPTEQRSQRVTHMGWTDGLQRGDGPRGRPGARTSRISSTRVQPHSSQPPAHFFLSRRLQGWFLGPWLPWRHPLTLKALSHILMLFPSHSAFQHGREKEPKGFRMWLNWVLPNYQPWDIGFVTHIT